MGNLGWEVLGCELSMREFCAGLIVADGSGRVFKVDPALVVGLGFGEKVAYQAGWLAGVASVLAGDVDPGSLQAAFGALLDSANDG